MHEPARLRPDDSRGDSRVERSGRDARHGLDERLRRHKLRPVDDGHRHGRTAQRQRGEHVPRALQCPRAPADRGTAAERREHLSSLPSDGRGGGPLEAVRRAAGALRVGAEPAGPEPDEPCGGDSAGREPGGTGHHVLGVEPRDGQRAGCGSALRRERAGRARTGNGHGAGVWGHGGHHVEPGHAGRWGNGAAGVRGRRHADVGGSADPGDGHAGFRERHPRDVRGRDRQHDSDAGDIHVRAALRAGGDAGRVDARGGERVSGVLRPARRGAEVGHGHGVERGWVRPVPSGRRPSREAERRSFGGAPSEQLGRAVPVRGRERLWRRGLPARGGGRGRHAARARSVPPAAGERPGDG